MELDRVAELPTWLLSRANARAQEILSAALGRAGARGYHYRLLAGLAQHGPLSQAELGRRTGIDRKDVAVAVAELEADALVVRTSDPTDARRRVVSLARDGERRLRDLDQVLAQAQAQVLAPLDPEERLVLTRLLAKLSGSGAGGADGRGTAS